MMATPTTYHELFNLLSNKDAPYVQPNSEGEVTFEDAQKLFDSFAKLEDLHFDADDNGCNHRKSLMQNLLIATGVKTATIMVYYDENRNWTHHFAPAIHLKGSDELFIIDPTLETQPVSIEQWTQTNGASPRDLTKPEYDIVGTKNPDQDLEKLAEFSKQQRTASPALRAA